MRKLSWPSSNDMQITSGGPRSDSDRTRHSAAGRDELGSVVAVECGLNIVRVGLALITDRKAAFWQFDHLGDKDYFAVLLRCS